MSMRKKLSGQMQVKEFMDNLEHPLKNEIYEVRDIILNMDDQITEHIKWNAPSFCVDDEDRVTFNLHGKGFFRLILHLGAKPKHKMNLRSLIKDDYGLLEWVAEDRAVIKITGPDDLMIKREQMKSLVENWLKISSFNE